MDRTLAHWCHNRDETPNFSLLADPPPPPTSPHKQQTTNNKLNMGQRGASKATMSTTGRLLARTMHLCSVVSGRSPRGKHSPTSSFRNRGVRFNPKIVVHLIPAVDQVTKSKMFYSRKEIAGFESLQKMEEVISMFALKRLGSPPSSPEPELPSDVDPKIKHRRGKRSRVSSECSDCTIATEQSVLNCCRLEI